MKRWNILPFFFINPFLFRNKWNDWYCCPRVMPRVGLGVKINNRSEFCSFIVRYPTAGASVYCGHISSFVWFGLNVAFNNLSVISRRCLDVTGSSMLTFRVLPHWNIMPQILWHDIPPSHIILTLSWPVPIPSSTFLMLSTKRKSS